MLSGLRYKGWIGTAVPLSTGTWGDHRDRISVCLQGRRASESLFRTPDMIARVSPQVIYPYYLFHPSINDVKRVSMNKKNDTEGNFYICLSIWTTKGVFVQIFKYFHWISEWFYDSMWFKTIKHIRCSLLAL